jgi:hypothetical protein
MPDVQPEEAPREPGAPALRLLKAVPLLVILGLLVHFVLPRLDTIQESFKTLRTMLPWAVAAALAMEGLSYLANGMLLRSVVGLAGERLAFGRACAIEIAAGTVSLVAAGALGFGAAIYRWTHESEVSTDAAMMASWLPSIFDSATLVIFAIASAIELLLFHHLSRATVIALVIVVSVLGAVVGLTVVLLMRNDWMVALARRAARLLKRIRPSADEYVLTDAAERAASTWKAMRRGGWVHPVVSSLLVLGFDLGCLACVFLAAGQYIHPTVLIAGYGVPLLLGRASFLPGGIAVTEVAMAALYSGLGIAPNVAVIVVLVYRLISFWLPTFVGIPIAFALHSQRKTESSDPAT